VILSSLPTEQINALFLYLNPFLPAELEVTTPDNRRMNLMSIFGNSSMDYHFLSEKIKIYLDLYFNQNMPIIQQITQSKTISFVKDIIINDVHYEMTQYNLKKIYDVQINPRKILYNLLIDHIQDIAVT